MGKFDQPASNVDVGPTLLGLAGINSYSISPPMDGRSVAPLLVDVQDAAVLPATRRHLVRESAVWMKSNPGHGNLEDYSLNWRNVHFVEYYSLGNVVRTNHLVDDAKSNTYRALRFTHGGPVGSGNMLYAEFTSLDDWNFKNYSFVEIFDLDKDPHQLTNLAKSTSVTVKAKLHDQVQSMWECSGRTCERASYDGE